MINKNKFSIKDTKKVLHKVGKRWVVVSAVLLGLVAGGAAVTTQANAAENDMTANHATPTETSVVANSAVAQPTHTTRLGAEFGGAAPASNPLDNDVNNAKDKVNSQLKSVKTKIQQDSSYADVTNLTKLADTVRGNTNATSAYQNLGSLASSADNFNNIALGEDTATPASDTVFGMFSQASNDFNTIYNAQNTTKGQHYLGKITNLFSQASDFANSSAVGKVSNNSYNINSSSSISIPLNGSIRVGAHNLTLSGSVDPTLDFYSNVSIDVPSIINSGMNISSVVNDFANTFISENNKTNVMSIIVSQAEAANDTNIYNYLHSNGLLPSPTNASTYANTYMNLKNNSTLAGIANAIVQDTPDELNNYITDNLGPMISFYESMKVHTDPHIYDETSSKISKAKALNSLLNPNSTQINTQTVNNINTAKHKLQAATNVTDATNALEPILDFGSTPAGVNQMINGLITDDAPTMFSSAVHNAASNVASFTGSLFATSGNSLSNYSFGPFVNDNLSDVTTYLHNLDNKLSSANASSLGLPTNITLIINDLIGKAHSYVDTAFKDDNRVTDVLNKFFSNTSTTKGAYNDLISKVATLPNDLKPTSHVAADNTEEAKLYSDYSAIDNDANTIITAANRHNATESGSVQRYVSDATRDANKSIVSEASSFAASMSSTSASMSTALDHAYNASESAATNLNNNDKTLENSLLNKNNSSVNTLLSASANYSNSLNGQNTSMALDTDTITFKSNNSNVGSSVVLTGFSGANFSANSLDIPSNYSLNNPTSTISFNGSSANAIFNNNVSVNVTLNKFNETVNFINKDNGSNVGHESFTNVPRNYTESLASLSIPSSYKLASSANNELVFNSNSQVDPVYVEPKQETDTIDYRDGDTPEGSTSLTGSNGAVIPSTAYNKIDSGFVLNGNPELTYDGGTHNVNVKSVPATSVTDHVVFNGAPSIDNYSKTSASNTHYNVSAPAGYHFTTGSTSSASFTLGRSNSTVTFDVASNTVNEEITFAGDSNATSNHRLVSGSYNTSSSVSAPSNYHFANGSTESSFAFGISNGSTTLNVVKNSIAATSVTDTIIFNGDNNASESVSGSVNTSASVSAPTNYHFTNGSASEATFNLGNSAHNIVLNVASNSSYHPAKVTSVTDTVVFNGDNNSSESVSGNANTSASVSAPTNYHFTNGNSSEATFNLGNSAHNIVLNVASNSSTPVTPAHHQATTTSVTDTVVFNGDNNASESVSGSDNTSASVSAPANYHFTNGNSSEAMINLGSSAHNIVLNVASNSSSKPESNTSTNSSATNNFMPEFSSSATSSSVSASAKSSSVSTKPNSSSVEPKKHIANYVTVNKALRLHTHSNFTKKNGIIIVKPGTRLDLEKVVKARHGLIRYEVNYKGNNYFITANKKFTTHMSYALAKPNHYRYFKVGKALQLHTSPYFNKKNGIMVVKPGAEFRINRVVKAHGLIRYEVSYKGSVYFITANKVFSANAYLQKSNFGKHNHKSVKVIKNLSEYKHAHFTKRGLIRSFRKGSVLPVKRVITIANGEMTRLQLTNGRYVSANKDFVKVIK